MNHAGVSHTFLSVSETSTCVLVFGCVFSSVLLEIWIASSCDKIFVGLSLLFRFSWYLASILVSSCSLLYIYRFLFRIWPLYCVIILVYAAFGKYLGAGPLFDWQSERVRDCNNNALYSIFFVNNFVKPREMVNTI